MSAERLDQAALRRDHRQLEAALASASLASVPALEAYLRREEQQVLPQLALLDASEVEALRAELASLRRLVGEGDLAGAARVFKAHVTREEALLSRWEAAVPDEHDALEQTLADVSYLVEHRSYFSAAKRFGELRRELEQHVADEEQIIVPAFIERTGDPNAAAVTIRAEHVDLLRWLETLGRCLSAGDHLAFVRLLPDFQRALRQHAELESRVLVPALREQLPTAAAWHGFIDERRRQLRLRR